MSKTYRDSKSFHNSPRAKREPMFPMGPGGMDCSCCFPARGTAERKKIIKAVRRKQNRFELIFSCEQI